MLVLDHDAGDVGRGASQRGRQDPAQGVVGEQAFLAGVVAMADPHDRRAVPCTASTVTSKPSASNPGRNGSSALSSAWGMDPPSAVAEPTTESTTESIDDAAPGVG